MGRAVGPLPPCGRRHDEGATDEGKSRKARRLYGLAQIVSAEQLDARSKSSAAKPLCETISSTSPPSSPQKILVLPLQLPPVHPQRMRFAEHADDLARLRIGEHRQDVGFAFVESVDGAADRRLGGEEIVAPLREGGDGF